MARAGVSPFPSRDSIWVEVLMVDIKNSAFLHTQFTEFVYMDSVSPPLLPVEKADVKDNIPLADPAELFDSIEYKQSGSVFWADLNKDHRKSSVQFSLKKRWNRSDD